MLFLRLLAPPGLALLSGWKACAHVHWEVGCRVCWALGVPGTTPPPLYPHPHLESCRGSQLLLGLD